jgi:hypothetical protein
MNILTALSWGFGTLTVLAGLFIYLSSHSEVDDPEFKTRFRRAFDHGAGTEVGARMVGAFYTAHDQPLRTRWKLFWFFLTMTSLALGGLYLI